MIYLKIYLIGFFASFLFIILTEHFYFCSGMARYVKPRAILEDLLLSLFSWLMLLVAIVNMILEYRMGCPERGYDAMLGNLEDSLRDQYGEPENKNSKPQN